KLWSERSSEEESFNGLLRRLLRLRPASEGQPSRASGVASRAALNGSWTWKGVVLPPGTELRMRYLGMGHEGEVKEGKWWINGNSYTTPSEAAGDVARTRDGKRPSLDGWKYWYVKRPEDADWLALNDLRDGSSHKSSGRHRRKPIFGEDF